MEKEIAERLVMALEGIEAELKTVNGWLEKMHAEPNFAPMGIAVVDKSSPEGIRARLAAGGAGGSIPRPT